MSIKTLDSWKIHLVLKNEQKKVLFSGFVENQKVMFYPLKFDIASKVLVSNSNINYKLGVAHPEYEKKFPNAKRVLFDFLRKNNNHHGNKT